MRKITFLALTFMMAGSVFAQQSFNQPVQTQNRGESSVPHTKSMKVMTGNIVSNNNYIAGTTMDINFTLNLMSPDFEYGDSLWMQFPAGFTINTASNPFAVATETQPDEALNTPIVSPVVSWGDNDNNYGGIELGQHNFFVNVTIPAGTTGSFSISWYLSGDEYGAAPNFLQGTTMVNPLPSVPDMKVTGTYSNKYYSFPIALPRDLVVGANVTNAGADLTTAADLTLSIPGWPYSGSDALTVPFATGTVQTPSITIPASANEVGMNDIYLDVNNANDFNPADSKDTLMVNISDSVYAYMDTITGGASLGIGDGSDGMIGSIYEIPNTASISSISFYSPIPDPTASVSFVIYEVDASGPTNVKVFESDTFVVTGTGPTMYNRPVNMSLTGGSSYFIGVREQSTGSSRIGTSATMGYFMDTHYAYFNASWLEIGGAGFAVGLAVYPNFAASCEADFSFTIDAADPMKVHFVDESTIPNGSTISYAWDFDDGNSANIDSPVYTYTADGTYNVCLNISDGADCSSSKCASVTVDDGINSVASIPVNNLKVYPNPSTGVINVDYAKNAEITIYSIDGSTVKVLEIVAGLTEINLTELPKGTYLMKITSEEGVSVKRISLMR